jgi:flagellar biogenesis protein FliO
LIVESLSMELRMSSGRSIPSLGFPAAIALCAGLVVLVSAANGQGSVNQALYTAPLPASQASGISLSPRQSKSDTTTPLAPRARAPSSDGPPATGDALLTTLGSLALVLCLFFAVAWIMRRGTPHSQAVLPGEVVELLGRAPLPGRHQMHLLRCGSKLLLVAVSNAGADTLTEITDPLEVDRLCGICRENHPKSATATFRSIMQQLGRESAEDVPQPIAQKSRKTRFSGAIEEDDA